MVAFPFMADAQAALEFVMMNGSVPVVPDSGEYKNDLGQSYTVSMFKFYISGLKLLKKDGKIYSDEGYYLINLDEPSSLAIGLPNIDEGDYTGISFIIGVDSAHNCSGAQSGALDPVNGMFWAWNTGYIFLKLEGKAPASLSPGHIFEYHIGGYQSPHNCIRTVDLALEQPLHLEKGKNKTIRLKTDIAEILKGPLTIDFSKLSAVTDFHNATTIADNYKDMFSVLSGENAK